MPEPVYHIPALLSQTVSALVANPGGAYADATFGGGGHSRGILAALSREGRLYCFDRDAEAIELNAIDDPRAVMINGNFRYLENYLRYCGQEPGTMSGVLADLGVSFHHFDDPERGFSFRFDSPLDMRMNRAGGRTAASLLADCAEEELAGWLHTYGELRQSRRLAATIIRERAKEPIATAGRLAAVAEPLLSPRQVKKEMAQLFQALRIVVNDEMGALRSLLEQSTRMLAPGGRLCVITYHSLEDRLVKNYMRSGNFDGREDKDIYGRSSSPLKPLGSKGVIADSDEVQANPRSRSARLRTAVKQ